MENLTLNGINDREAAVVAAAVDINDVGDDVGDINLSTLSTITDASTSTDAVVDTLEVEPQVDSVKKMLFAQQLVVQDNFNQMTKQMLDAWAKHCEIYSNIFSKAKSVRLVCIHY
jgi:hypothetical protein